MAQLAQENEDVMNQPSACAPARARALVPCWGGGVWGVVCTLRSLQDGSKRQWGRGSVVQRRGEVGSTRSPGGENMLLVWRWQA